MTKSSIYCALITISLMGYLHPSLAIYGYDCDGILNNVTAISLLDVGGCDIKMPKLNITKIHAQLLQINDFTSTRVFTCSVKISRTVSHCSRFMSFSSRVLNGELAYYKDITRDECMKMQENGFFSIAGTNIIGLQRNGTTHKSIIFAGSVTSDGDCKGSSFADPYGKYDDVVAQGWVEITLKDYYTEVHIEAGKIKLNSGMTCPIAQTTCVDFDAGHAFWNALPSDVCGITKFSILYEGIIDKIHDEDANKVMFRVETPEITFALWQKGEIKKCGLSFARTEHPRLFIVENAIENDLIQKNDIATANMDIFAYINSKFVYVEKHFKDQIDKMYFDILKQKCELERKVLINALSIATLAPEEFGYRIMQEAGYLGIITGEVIHLIKCIRVEVEIRPTPNECYDQLPVFKGKKPLFLSPRTRILLRRGTPIHCDQRLPSMYKLDNAWLKLEKKGGSLASEPEILRPNIKPTWKYNSPESLAISGIYSEKDTSRLREMILFPMEKNAVLNKVALGITGHRINNEGLSISQFLDQNVIESIAENTWNRLWGKFQTFGSASAGIIGIFVIIHFFKVLIDTIIHGYAIYSIYGFSLHLVGALLNSVTQLILHLGNQAQREEREMRNEDSRELTIVPIQRETPPSSNPMSEQKNMIETEKNNVVGLYPNLLNNTSHDHNSL